MKSVGIDIGGTKIAGASISEDGSIVQSLSVPSHPDDPDALVEAVGGIVAELADDETSAAVGVAAAAFLNRERTHVYFSPNINWPNFPLKARLEEALSRPIVLENDANAAGWAEYRFGAGQGSPSFIMLTLGTGVGGSIIEQGRLLTGAFGTAGELGHLVVEPDGARCGCGNRGCLEQYASGTALMARAREAMSNPTLTSDEAVGLFVSGNPALREIFDDVAEVLARALTSLVALTDPEVVVIGGGVAKAGSLLTESIERKFAEHYPAHTQRPTARIELAVLGSLAGAVGAADLARRGAL